jgi:hypothetical protein
MKEIVNTTHQNCSFLRKAVVTGDNPQDDYFYQIIIDLLRIYQIQIFGCQLLVVWNTVKATSLAIFIPA